jgi:hypothetical protein
MAGHREYRFLSAGGDVLTIPPGVSHLSIDGARPTLRAAHTARAALEPLPGRRGGLLLLTPRRSTLRVNGRPAPRVCVLHVKDELQLDGWVLHVTVHQRPHVGAPGTEHLGALCPVCRIAFVAETRVYVCPNCEHATHLEDASKPAEARLECLALSSDCPQCHEPVRMEEGYVHVPAL